MNFEAFDKKTVLLFGGLFIVCAILLILAFSLLRPSSDSTPDNQQETPQQQNFIQSFFSSEPSISAVSPTKDTLLIPGKTPPLTITFNKPVRLDTISIVVTEHIIPLDTTNEIKVALSPNSSGNTVTVTPSLPLKPSSAYTLTISLKNPVKKLYSQTYQTTLPIPTPLSQNNAELQQYLPYETATYALSYLPKKNMYVFNFIFNPNDPTDIQVQFEQAKQNAILYIKSKGIDPNSVVVDWRYH